MGLWRLPMIIQKPDMILENDMPNWIVPLALYLIAAILTFIADRL